MDESGPIEREMEPVKPNREQRRAARLKIRRVLKKMAKTELKHWVVEAREKRGQERLEAGE